VAALGEWHEEKEFWVVRPEKILGTVEVSGTVGRERHERGQRGGTWRNQVNL
jgi:hypothetical protein